ncbi:MAG: ABC transporter substrate-binding protein [Flavobacteriaceae bacterium]|nr:ABC transporter substrate-binding protein [Flavobacteriaceae bacterium]
MKTSKEIRSAILVLSGIFLFIFIFNYLKGENLFSRSIKIISVYENVEGLSESSSVTINGHTVGKVQDINFSNDGSGNLEVVMLIDTDLKFSRNSYAELYESGLIGGKAIAIVPVKDNAPHAKTGDILSSRTKPGLTDLVNQRLTPLQEKIESVMVSADKILINLNSIFDNKTKINLKNSIINLNQTLISFEKASNSIDEILNQNKYSLKSSIDNINLTSNKVVNIANDLSEIKFKQTIDRLNNAVSNLNVLTEKINQGQGSIGKLVKDESLYNNLQASLFRLEALLADIKQNPKRYVHFSLFGKKDRDSIQ